MATIVVLGGGLAGVACVGELDSGKHDVVLIDQHNYLQFQPLLYQVASSQLPAEDVARPLPTIFDGHPEVAVVTATVSAVDLTTRTVTTEHGRYGPADALVFASGSQPNFFGVPGAAEHSFPLYSVKDAQRLQVHLRDQLRLRRPGQPNASRRLDVVIVGGGPTGVESAGALAEMFRALRKQSAVAAELTVHLVDHGTKLLAPFTDESQRYALQRLTADGVDVRFGVGVTGVDPDGAQLSDGSRIDSSTVIWAGGISAAPVAGVAGATTGRGGRIDVAPDLSVPGAPGVYAVGDCANIPGPGGHPLPQLGSVAQQSGRWAAHNIHRQLSGEATTPFSYRDKGILAMIGRNAAVAEIGPHRHQFDGALAFAAWLGVHAVLLTGTHSRVDAFLNWADDYLHSDRSADLELDGPAGRIAWADDAADRPRI